MNWKKSGMQHMIMPKFTKKKQSSGMTEKFAQRFPAWAASTVIQFQTQTLSRKTEIQMVRAIHYYSCLASWSHDNQITTG
ncbi:hypothetical protein GQ457_14G026880 [Hibiscus cannabinus]